MGKERSNCMIMLKLRIMRKLKNLLQLISNFDVVELVETPRANNEVVPNDVKEGYFAVFSVNPEEEPKRFILELHWLTNPSFLKLLKQAEDEYGFEQKGVLEVPCRAEELQNILELKNIVQNILELKNIVQNILELKNIERNITSFAL